jgi:hypothetical protein
VARTKLGAATFLGRGRFGLCQELVSGVRGSDGFVTGFGLGMLMGYLCMLLQRESLLAFRGIVGVHRRFAGQPLTGQLVASYPQY